MDIYLIRHGAAVDLDNEIPEEGFRYLTREGRKKSAQVAERLKDLHVHFDLILTSPLVRAVQTAEIFATVLKHKSDFKTAVELIGGSSFNRFIQLLKRNSHHKSIACFGHSPDVNHFAVGLLKTNDVKELKINFKTCSVCKIRFSPEKETGKFIWFLKSDTMELVNAA
jgi:phosphohistidine phosphatase